MANNTETAQSDRYEENTEFNNALDAEVTFEITGFPPENNIYQYRPSEVLFYTDPSAYESELKSWVDDQKRQAQKDAIDHIKSTEQIAKFNRLCTAIARRRIAPFVGAGLSRPTFPLWSQALFDIADRITCEETKAIKEMISQGKFLDAAQELWNLDETQVKNYIQTRFDKASIPSGGVSSAIKLLPRISNGCVITTNFDSVIEDVFKDDPFDGYMHGMQKGNKFATRLIRGDRCLLKLHGDAEDHETYIFTHDQYASGYGNPIDFTKHLPKSLRQIFVSHSLLFLGCSLEEDQTMSLFREVIEEGQFDIPDHIAILPEPEKPTVKSEKETRLLKLQIHPIWYPPNQHQMVKKILNLAIEVANKRLSI